MTVVGGQNVGWIDGGDWMSYNVTVAATGNYAAQFRVAGFGSGAQLQLKNGSTVLATVNVPNTGGGQVWSTVSANVSLTAGAQTLTVAVVTGGFNFNWMSFAQPGARDITTTDLTKHVVGFPNPGENIYYINGVENGSPVNIVDLNGKSTLKTKVSEGAIDISSLRPGNYILNIRNKREMMRIKLFKK